MKETTKGDVCVPFVKEYGCLQTSQFFFLLWASHVVRLAIEISLPRSGTKDGWIWDVPVLVNVSDGTRAFARMKKGLVGLRWCATDSACICEDADEMSGRKNKKFGSRVRQTLFVSFLHGYSSSVKNWCSKPVGSVVVKKTSKELNT